MASSRTCCPAGRRALLVVGITVAAASWALLAPEPARAAATIGGRLGDDAPGRLDLAGLSATGPGVVRSSGDVPRWLERVLAERGLRSGIDGFAVVDERVDRGLLHVRLRQTWNGLPVERGAVSVRIGADGRPAVLGGFVPNVDPGVALAPEPIVRASAMNATGLDGARWSSRAERWVVRRGNQDHFAWRVVLTAGPGEAERRAWFVGEATTPEHVDTDLVPASALVYPDDGSQPLREVLLENLSGDGSLLRGKNVKAQLRTAELVFVPGGDYRVVPTDPDTTLFDAANVYWYADRYVETFLRPLGFRGFDSLLTIRVQDDIWPPYTAATLPGFCLLAPAVEYFFRDPAKARDLVTHEIQHAVTYALGVYPEGPRGEAAALHEALSDYFTCASTGKPSMGEWVYFRFPQGATRVDAPAAEFRYSRYDSVQFGPNLPRSPWANGMILSGALWDLRRAIGTSSDSLILEALPYLPSSFAWVDFANALLVADADHHHGRFGNIIARALLGREIRGFMRASMEGPSEGRPMQPLHFSTVDPWPPGTAEFEWWVLRECRDRPCPEGWRRVAVGVAATVTEDVDCRVRLIVKSAWGTSDTTERFVSLMPPQARIVGPSRLTQRSVGEWKVEAIAATDLDILWFRTWRRQGASRTALGFGSNVAFAADTAFVLEAQVQDRRFRSVQLRSDVYTDPPLPPGPPISSGLLQLAIDLRSPAREGEIRFEVPFGGRSTLGIYDVTGRVRRELWDGEVSPGAHVLRWSAADLEPGVYLLRLDAPRGHLVRKFAVLR